MVVRASTGASMVIQGHFSQISTFSDVMFDFKDHLYLTRGTLHKHGYISGFSFFHFFAE